MTVRFITPTCPDQTHKRHGWSDRKAHPAIAIVRLQVPSSRWTPRCRDCLNRLRSGTTHFDVAYLDGHDQGAAS